MSQLEYPKKLEHEFKKLLNIIGLGVTKHGLTSFNKIISGVVSKGDGKEQKINMVYKVVCSHFKIPVETLINSKSRGSIYDAKIITFKLLNSNVGISAKGISKMFNRYPNSVSHAIKKFESLDIERRKVDKKLYDDYQICEVKFFESLELIKK